MAVAVLTGRETYGVAGPGLPEPRQPDGRDDGENRIAGGNSSAPVEDQDLVAGRNLDGTDRDTARQHLGAGLPVRDGAVVGAGEAQADVVAAGADGVAMLVKPVDGADRTR